jgi:hypothetical protein
MTAIGRVTWVTLDDTGVEIGVEWETIGETIRADVDSLQAEIVRLAAEEVVSKHFAHLRQGGYIIGEPPPNEDSG